MPAITLNIPANAMSRVQDAFAFTYGYQDMIPDANGNPIPNPKTKPQFVQEKIKAYVQEVVHGYESNAAQATAAASVQPVAVTVS